MKNTMRAAVLRAGGGIEMRDLPVPAPGPGEALIKVLVCGVCTSDMGVYVTGLGEDAVLGHEVVGIVAALGEGVRSPAVGTRVTGAIMRGYAEYTVARADALLTMPESLPDQEGIVEPFSCLMSGIRRAGGAIDQPVCVVGAGYMGLALIALLKAAGYRDIAVSEPRRERAENALQLGASRIAGSGSPERFPLVFEAAGVQGALDTATALCARDGTLTIVGYHPARRSIDMAAWCAGAFTVINAFEYDRTRQLKNMKQALEMTASGALPAGKLLTGSHPLEQTDEAFKLHQARPEGYLKGYVRVAERGE